MKIIEGAGDNKRLRDQVWPLLRDIFGTPEGSLFITVPIALTVLLWIAPSVLTSFREFFDWMRGASETHAIALDLARHPRPMHDLTPDYWINQLREATALKVMPGKDGATLGCAAIPTLSKAPGRLDVPVEIKLSTGGRIEWGKPVADDPAFAFVCD